MGESSPNIALLMTDQQRADCLGVDGHPVVQTPNLDEVAAHGVRFRHGYAECPICIPARRTLMTGQTPHHHGARKNPEGKGPIADPVLPQVLAEHGYQTHLSGKLHLFPPRKRYGFHSEDWADGPGGRAAADHDYARFLARRGVVGVRRGTAHGVKGNSMVARPWHLDESLHYSNWCADTAIAFLERRDPTRPFFLNVSFFHPHPPCTPPQMYYDRYMRMELPEPVVGDWAHWFDHPALGAAVDQRRIRPTAAMMKQLRAAYYGCINHIDDQIRRVLDALPPDTVLVFCSDHGEMLGDHQWQRKGLPYEASARIPYFMRFPEGMGIEQPQVRDEPVALMDLMPTLLDAAGAAIPDTVDGSSLIPLLQGARGAWRDAVHGEVAYIPEAGSRSQWITDGRRKYIWWPDLDREQLFDLEEDPNELHDAHADPRRLEALRGWRHRLAERLSGREA